MAIQTQITPIPYRPARRTATPVALHPSLLLREVAGESADTETLRVRGQSMRDALLGPGDQILLQRDALPAEGELVVLRLPGSRQPRLRRIFHEAEALRLEPESPRFPGETLPAEEVEILGRVVAILRRPR